jgi:hypothetical protein
MTLANWLHDTLTMKAEREGKRAVWGYNKRKELQKCKATTRSTTGRCNTQKLRYEEKKETILKDEETVRRQDL